MFNLLFDPEIVNLYTVLIIMLHKISFYLSFDPINCYIIENLMYIWLFMLFIESIIYIYNLFDKQRNTDDN